MVMCDTIEVKLYGRQKDQMTCLFNYTVSGNKVLRQMMSDFNEILHQQCSIELQTNRKISVKYVNNCNSYSGFSAGTQKMKCPL